VGSPLFHVWGLSKVAKVNIVEFANQVKNETKKVIWPTRRETVTTAIMVLIMTTILGLFFLGIDSLFNALVKALLSLLD
jgi:preprotein translocase subunit SecE